VKNIHAGIGQHIIWSSRRGTVIAFWQSADGQWHWHRKVNGRVTASGSYARRSSVRRFLAQTYGRETL
jgi:hypothetical protein